MGARGKMGVRGSEGSERGARGSEGSRIGVRGAREKREGVREEQEGARQGGPHHLCGGKGEMGARGMRGVREE